jgi:hypothetical protein
MKQVIGFPLEGDETILVEVEMPEEEYGETEVSRPGEVVRKASETFQKAISTVKPVAETIINELSNLSKRPQEVDVEFSLKMSAEAKAIVASIGGEANFKVTLKWKQENSK